MASTTKIMTALLALQIGKLDDRITVPRAAFNYEWDATVMGLRPGQVVTLRDLLYGLLLPSGADAANTIAIHYGGSETRFVAMMNRLAATLGLKDTHYANAHGLTARNHYTSVYDLAMLGQYVSYLPTLAKIVSARTYSWNGHTLINLNRVLFWYPGVDGIKPGYTNDAGLCQVLDAQRNGRHIIVAVLNTPDLVIDARNLLNFGLRDFSWVQSTLPGDRPSLTQAGIDQGGSYVYFPGSGHYIRGALWNGFLANGGFDTLGFPRTEPLWEGKARVQYFQNGALALDGDGHIARRALGLTPLPTPTPTPSPPPTPTATLKPMEKTIPATVSSSPTPTRTAVPRLTATSTPRPGLPMTPTPKLPPSVAQVFADFQRSHRSVLGQVATDPVTTRGYLVQVFAYGALAYDQKKRGIYLLPLGDRLLSVRRYLPAHPGNAYPVGFAPVPVMKAIGWPPYGTFTIR